MTDLQAGTDAVICCCWIGSEISLEQDAISLIVLHACHKEVKAEDDAAQPLNDLAWQLQRLA